MTATNAGGTGSADSNPVGPVVSQLRPPWSRPSLSGDAIVGSTLTVDPGSWSDPTATFTYVWLRCDDSGSCTPIDEQTVRRTPSPPTTRILDQVKVTATTAAGTGDADSNLVGPVVPQPPPVVVTLPSVSGDAIVGSILTADPGTWSDPTATFSYAWLRCHGNESDSCTTIEGADDPTYMLTSDDLDFLMRVEVTAANAAGTATAESTPTAPIESAGQ